MSEVPDPPNTIWKYEIPCQDEFDLELPIGALPLSVGVQQGVPVLWLAVNNRTTGRERRRFVLALTGKPLPDLLWHRFIGTFQLEEIGFVGHLFEEGPVE